MDLQPTPETLGPMHSETIHETSVPVKRPWRKSYQKPNRLKHIRAGAAAILSKIFRKKFEPRDITFIDHHRRGYNWFLEISTIINKKTGGKITTEYDLPTWTQKQMWRWHSDEAKRMIDWIDYGLLKVEKIYDGKVRRRERQLEETAGMKELESIHSELHKGKEFIQEVCVTVYTKKELEDLKHRWVQPKATIKGPASDFIAWMTGSTDREVAKKMSQKYLEADYDSEDSDYRLAAISYDQLQKEANMADVAPRGDDLDDLPLIYLH